METVYIGLGSNLKDRLAFLNTAVEKLSEHEQVEIVRLSSIYETDPVGGAMQGRYFNAVCAVKTGLSPEELLQFTKKIEYDMGRRRKGHWEARFIDLDILVYPGIIKQSPELNLPHPLIARRWFVLIPLAEIAPNLTPPGYSKNISELLIDLGEPEGIDRLEIKKPWGPLSHKWSQF